MTIQLKIDMDELIEAMQTESELVEYFLDLESGEIIPVSHDLGISPEEDYDEEDVESLSDWQKTALAEAKEILSNEDRYISIETIDSREAYQDMVDFAESIREDSLRELLRVALDGSGAFRRFKDVLQNYPEKRQRWFKFREKIMKQRAREWLDSIHVEPISGHPEGDQDPD